MRNPSRPTFTPTTGTPRRAAKRAAQERAVAADGDHEIARRPVARRSHPTPRDARARRAAGRGRRDRRRTSLVHHERDPVHDRIATPSATAPTSVGAVPGGPALPRAARGIPRCRQGRAAARPSPPARRARASARGATTSSRTRTHTSGSRTTPPAPTAPLPASNCGFTRITIGRRRLGDAVAASGSTTRSEMNDRSATTRFGATADRPSSGLACWSAPAPSHGDRAQLPRQLPVPDVDRHHAGRAPAQQHIGEPTGRRSGVEARRAHRVDAKRSSAAASFSPARETYGRDLPTDRIARRPPTIVAGLLATVTRDLARSRPPPPRAPPRRLPLSPRRTSSASSRRRVTPCCPSFRARAALRSPASDEAAFVAGPWRPALFLPRNASAGRLAVRSRSRTRLRSALTSSSVTRRSA